LNERSVGTVYDELKRFVNSFLNDLITVLGLTFWLNIALDNKIRPMLPIMTERSLNILNISGTQKTQTVLNNSMLCLIPFPEAWGQGQAND
jgi:hypothetical protein